jgi:hypothetical protein
VVLALAACGGDDSDGESEAGHAELRFSGAVTGEVVAPLEVSCFEPVEDGDRYTVSIDSDLGVKVGDRTFVALDVAVPGYRDAGNYDLDHDSVEPDDFFLLFRETQEDPFGWTGRGRIVVSDDGRSGRLELPGWTDGTGAVVDLNAAFRCGTAGTASGR